MSDPANIVTQTEESEKNKETETSPKTPPKVQATSSSFDNWFALIFWVVIVGGIIIYNNLAARTFFVDHWWEFGLALVLVVIGIMSYQPLRQKIKSSVHTRVGTIIVALAGIAILEAPLASYSRAIRSWPCDLLFCWWSVCFP